MAKIKKVKKKKVAHTCATCGFEKNNYTAPVCRDCYKASNWTKKPWDK